MGLCLFCRIFCRDIAIPAAIWQLLLYLLSAF